MMKTSLLTIFVLCFLHAVDADVEEVGNCDLSNYIHCSVVKATDDGRIDVIDKLLAIPTSLNFAMKLLPSESNFLVVNGLNNFYSESADHEDVMKALELGRSEVINTCIMHGEEGTIKLLTSEKISLFYTFLIERVQMELKSGPNYMEGTRNDSIKPGSYSILDIENALNVGDWSKAAAIAASPRNLAHGWNLLPGSVRKELVLAKKREDFDKMDKEIAKLIETASELVQKVQETANIESIHEYHCADNDEFCFAINMLEFYKFYKQKQLEKYFKPTLPSCAAA